MAVDTSPEALAALKVRLTGETPVKSWTEADSVMQQAAERNRDALKAEAAPVSGRTGGADMSEKTLRFKAPGPWVTRDLKDCVLASAYDSAVACLREIANAQGDCPCPAHEFARDWLERHGEAP